MTGPASLPLTGTRRVDLTFTHRVAPDDLSGRSGGGASFLDVLLRRFPYHTADEWRERIADGRVTLAETRTTPDATVACDDLITYRVSGYEEPAVPIDFRELVSAGDLALVHKPAGLPVHKTGRIFLNVLAGLYRTFKDDEAWAPLNRLDAETSGIVAFARGKEALRRFAPNAPGITWKKTYLAVVDGIMSAPCTHEGPLAEWRDHPIRSRMRVHPDGKRARTEFTPLATTRDGKTLVLAQPVTGRKHQIRAHLADFGFPIVGDKIYNHEGRYYLKRLQGHELTPEDYATLGAPYQLLHAVGLEILQSREVVISTHDRGLPEPFEALFPHFPWTEKFPAVPPPG